MRRWRRDVAWASLLAISAGLSLSQVLGATSWLVPFVIALAYPAGRRMASLSLALWVLGVLAFVGLAVLLWRSPEPTPDFVDMMFVEFALSVVPWWAGRHRRLRIEQREREHRIVAEQARLRERARIAQDMHDSLGHELALIAVHGGALEVATNLTGDQRRAAGELRAGAVRATHRLHEIVHVLGDRTRPQDRWPSDESIDGVVKRAAAAGLRVSLRNDGPAPAWSPMTRQAAYRVVQEALTNAARHAPDASITVTLSREPDGTRVEIVNDAPARPSGDAGTGLGLIGLDERVRLAGGRMSAGPRLQGGWSVAAVLPDDAKPWPAGSDQPVLELGASKRLTRRQQLLTALLPTAIGIAVVTALVVVDMLAVVRTGLPSNRYESLRLGQPREAIQPLLPPRDIRPVPPVVTEGSRPAGATCLYYRAGTGLFEPGVYRLCLLGGVLVSKDRLERA